MMMEESPMRKKQYIAAVACLVAGAIGFAGVYATEKGQERNNTAQDVAQETQQTAPASYEVKPQDAAVQEEEEKTDTSDEPETEEQESNAEEATEEETEAAAASVTQDTLHFDKDAAAWPIEGEILLDYSMDASIYFPTLEQYRYNPAMVIAGAVNDKVFAMARGTITDIRESEETGCTVTQDLGDGYTAVYGQLKELNFAEGDTVEAGQVIGYVSEPTKYYSVEGSNVYFSLKKDGEAVDPKEYLPEMPMDTLD
jgi:murein DD-endopeptidase MepM/ murein hydrolase activator NlpD